MISHLEIVDSTSIEHYRSITVIEKHLPKKKARAHFVSHNNTNQSQACSAHTWNMLDLPPNQIPSDYQDDMKQIFTRESQL